MLVKVGDFELGYSRGKSGARTLGRTERRRIKDNKGKKKKKEGKN